MVVGCGHDEDHRALPKEEVEERSFWSNGFLRRHWVRVGSSRLGFPPRPMTMTWMQIKAIVWNLRVVYSKY